MIWQTLLIFFMLRYWDATAEGADASKVNALLNQKCDSFFHAVTWPLPLDAKNISSIRLCQNQKGKNLSGIPVFATLFSTQDRIPIYTAYTVVLYQNATSYERPDGEYWHRVAEGICPNTWSSSSNTSVYSEVCHVPHSEMEKCRKFQAVCDDYDHNALGLDRGHLSPNSINDQNLEKQRGTFTLTNAAPQFPSFNRFSWREYECVTKQTILDLVPGKKVYILTGTHGVAKDKNNNPIWMNGKDFVVNPQKNPVKVPGYYWKAVCFPGSFGHAPWGYAIVQKNVNQKTKANFKNYITLKEFALKYFSVQPFGYECMNASFGKFAAHVFYRWDEYLEKYCSVREK